MATKGSTDESLEMLFLQKSKIKLYVREEHINRMTADAKSLGVNRSTLLECILIKYLTEMANEKSIPQNKTETKQKASA